MVDGAWPKPSDPIIPRLVRHAVWWVNRYQRRAPSHTSYFALHGHEEAGSILPFAHTIMIRQPGTHQKKFVAKWAKAVWLGRTEYTDEHEAWAHDGLVRGRVVTRLHEQDKGLFNSVRATPWDITARGQKRQLDGPSMPAVILPGAVSHGGHTTGSAQPAPPDVPVPPSPTAASASPSSSDSSSTSTQSASMPVVEQVDLQMSSADRVMPPSASPEMPQFEVERPNTPPSVSAREQKRQKIASIVAMTVAE